jgi:hypothetical protein
LLWGLLLPLQLLRPRVHLLTDCLALHVLPVLLLLLLVRTWA